MIIKLEDIDYMSATELLELSQNENLTDMNVRSCSSSGMKNERQKI